ncbi:MAG: glycosyltransferase family 2 protein [Phycisphaerales bacterium]
MRSLVVIPVFNEVGTVERVLRRVRAFAHDVVVIDDASTDGTSEVLARLAPVLQIRTIIRERNAGYGRAMQDAFRLGAEGGYDWVITMDCDEQHEPDWIPRFLCEARNGRFDVISGSRYLCVDDAKGSPPEDRKSINLRITTEINDRLGLSLTDAFCGFKAYRVPAVAELELTEDGYAFPMQFWVEAVAAGLRIGEIPVRLIYTSADRSFGGGLDDPNVRYAHYRRVLHCAIRRRASQLPESALDGLMCTPCP